ncbi:hypothetical protein OCK74_17410 [Chitinophagaceae bacterium LB-8]|uniref:Uncharacterized protein n=1 Tax=Paraflavisolibacter caeni TaxID=2982496 RepID=A0A9X2XY61_9BACT|nr:hypothetical protein [Paraflavisolibacter caeni]MCU7550902.1 hypothetical protein [Paraflavisolibacter caeni]
MLLRIRTIDGTTLASNELAIIPIGAEVACSIKADSSNYVFTVNGKADKPAEAS